LQEAGAMESQRRYVLGEPDAAKFDGLRATGMSSIAVQVWLLFLFTRMKDNALACELRNGRVGVGSVAKGTDMEPPSLPGEE